MDFFGRIVAEIEARSPNRRNIAQDQAQVNPNAAGGRESSPPQPVIQNRQAASPSAKASREMQPSDEGNDTSTARAASSQPSDQLVQAQSEHSAPYPRIGAATSPHRTAPSRSAANTSSGVSSSPREHGEKGQACTTSLADLERDQPRTVQGALHPKVETNTPLARSASTDNTETAGQLPNKTQQSSHSVQLGTRSYSPTTVSPVCTASMSNAPKRSARLAAKHQGVAMGGADSMPPINDPKPSIENAENLPE